MIRAAWMNSITRCGLTTLLLFTLSVPAIAQEGGPQQSSVKQWLRRAGDLFGSGSLQRNAPEVKEVFKPLVVDAKKSTVKIYSDGKHISLGAVVFADGYVITKASEIKSDVLLCQFHDGRRLAAELIGVATDVDLAMLRVDAESLDVVSWADETPPVGSFLITTSLRDVPESLGVVSVAPRKIARPRGVLGVLLDEARGGALVSRVLKESGADKAGVKAGDVIVKVNDTKITSREDLVRTVQTYQPGDKVRLEIKRKGDKLEIIATLANAFNPAHGERQEFQESLGGPLSHRRAGFPSAIQHDTALRPQDCGGPLWDLEGKAVGINIARASRVGSYALPVSTVKPYLDRLRSGDLAPGPSLAARRNKLKEQISEIREAMETLEEKLALYQLMSEQSDANLKTAQAALENASNDEEAIKQLKLAQEEIETGKKMSDELAKQLVKSKQELKQAELELVTLNNK
ncbi:MAG: serine protease Do [Pirellulaceae bacterium]|jgi:serine protease Do